MEKREEMEIKNEDIAKVNGGSNEDSTDNNDGAKLLHTKDVENYTAKGSKNWY